MEISRNDNQFGIYDLLSRVTDEDIGETGCPAKAGESYSHRQKELINRR